MAEKKNPALLDVQDKISGLVTDSIGMSEVLYMAVQSGDNCPNVLGFLSRVMDEHGKRLSDLEAALMGLEV